MSYCPRCDHCREELEPSVSFIRSRRWYKPELDDEIIRLIKLKRDMITDKMAMAEMIDAHFS